MDIQDIRRARLAQLIKERYNASQAEFIQATGENQGEVSGLLKTKSFGEKKARKIEAKCDLPPGWLDDTDSIIEIAVTEQYQAPDTLSVTGSSPVWMDPDAYRLLSLYYAADRDGRTEIMNTAADFAQARAAQVVNHK